MSHAMSGNGGMDSMDMEMHTSFYWGKDAIILFSGWPKDSLGMYILAFFLVLLLAVCTEALSISPTATSRTGVLVQASVYALHTGLAYLVMLAVMSYNIGIFIAAIAGHFIGYFVVKVRALALVNRVHQNVDDPKL